MALNSLHTSKCLVLEYSPGKSLLALPPFLLSEKGKQHSASARTQRSRGLNLLSESLRSVREQTSASTLPQITQDLGFNLYWTH